MLDTQYLEALKSPIISSQSYLYENRRPLKLCYQFSNFDSNFYNNQIIIFNKNILQQYTKNAQVPSLELKELYIKSINEWAKIVNVEFSECKNNKVDIFLGTSVYEANTEDDLPSCAVTIPIKYDINVVLINYHYYTKNLNDHNLFQWIIIHEVGHILGLRHPGEENSITPPLNKKDNTVMSYKDFKLTNGLTIYPITPMETDIKTLQVIYGRNDILNKGNTVHKLSYIPFSLRAIWDPSGSDTIDCSKVVEPVVLDLRSGIDFKSKIATDCLFYISENTQIENAISGSGNDVITGNNLDNNITASNGNNVLIGNGGNDYFIFHANEAGTNLIKDFTHDEDLIVLKDFDKRVLEIITYNNKCIIRPSPELTITLEACNNIYNNDYIFG
jgi:hypothetical protein